MLIDELRITSCDAVFFVVWWLLVLSVNGQLKLPMTYFNKDNECLFLSLVNFDLQ